MVFKKYLYIEKIKMNPSYILTLQSNMSGTMNTERAIHREEFQVFIYYWRIFVWLATLLLKVMYIFILLYTIVHCYIQCSNVFKYMQWIKIYLKKEYPHLFLFSLFFLTSGNVNTSQFLEELNKLRIRTPFDVL